MAKHEFDVVTERGKSMLASVPHALSARYDRRIHRIVVELSSGYSILFAKTEAEGLEAATWEQLTDVKISSSGYGLHFPELDADLWIPGLLQGRFGSEKWMEERNARQKHARSANRHHLEKARAA
jgi:hypothetical protein